MAALSTLMILIISLLIFGIILEITAVRIPSLPEKLSVSLKLCFQLSDGQKHGWSSKERDDKSAEGSGV